jgi:hypothetical protein
MKTPACFLIGQFKFPESVVLVGAMMEHKDYNVIYAGSIIPWIAVKISKSMKIRGNAATRPPIYERACSTKG